LSLSGITPHIENQIITELQKTILSLRLEIQTLQSQILELKRPTALQEHKLHDCSRLQIYPHQLLAHGKDLFEIYGPLRWLSNQVSLFRNNINIFTGI
jgi:hypothetical protein